MKDVRWVQRFDNYRSALKTLADAVALSKTRKLSDLERQGLIQSFEFTHELAWKVLKDYLSHKGYSDLIGSKDATRTAFQNGLIEDGEAWMKMIEDRNLTSHTYQLEIAEEVAKDILDRFFPVFKKMEGKFSTLKKDEETES